jgi:hypothetical protein
MGDTYNAIAIASAAVIVLLALWTGVRMHAERQLSNIGVLLSAGSAVLALVIYELTLDVDLKWEAILGLLTGGAAIGIFAGRSIPLYIRQSRPVVRKSGWHLVPAMLAIAALQVTGARESFEGIVLALAALYATTAFGAIACVVLLVRRLVVRPSADSAINPGAAAPPVEGPRCRRCGELVRRNWSYCIGCGARLRQAAVSRKSAPI